MRRTMFTAAAVALLTAAVAAQTPAAKPGPEHKRMDFFAGTWNFQGEAKESPMGPGGKITGTETCQWFDGGFQLVCRSKGSGPKGATTGMSTMGYDQARKAYTFHAISSLGDNIFVRGNVSGKVWTWADETQIEGKPVKFRATVTEDTPTSYTFKLEAGMGDAPMMVIEEGKATKK